MKPSTAGALAMFHFGIAVGVGVTLVNDAWRDPIKCEDAETILREAITDNEVETIDDLATRAGVKIDWHSLRKAGS